MSAGPGGEFNLRKPNTGRRTVPLGAVGFVLPVLVVAVVFILGVYLRLAGLGAGSLWMDEQCTWHVSQLPLVESVKWAPELTTPPLYQVILRVITDSPRAPEWLLRFPSFLAGSLLVLVVYFMANSMGGRMLGLAAGLMVAVSSTLIDYSQEARAYSLLTLCAAVSMWAWYRLLKSHRPSWFVVYVLATVLGFHAHYMILPTVAGQVAWYGYVLFKTHKSHRPLAPLVALALTSLLCLPQVVLFVSAHETTLESFYWLRAPTIAGSVKLLGELAVAEPLANVWAICVIVPASLAWLVLGRPGVAEREKQSQSDEASGAVGLLLAWIGGAWFGLFCFSLLVRPILIDRYALPAAIPAILLPLLIAGKWKKWLPMALAVVFSLASVPQWLPAWRVEDASFREMLAFIEASVEPDQSPIVVTMDNTTNEEWERMYKVGFDYYPLEGYDVHFVPLRPRPGDPRLKVFDDPRVIYTIVFPGDVVPLLEQVGRRTTDIVYEGLEYSLMPFGPYLLYKVAAVEGQGG